MLPESDLMQALRHAVQGEARYGIREDCKEEIEARWMKVIELMRQLIKKKK